jgi:tellurite resistance protein TehA-like permease
MEDRIMAMTPVDQEVREHEDSYVVFRRIVLYAVMHIAFTVVCLAMASLGGETVFAAIVWICGTLAMLSMYVFRTTDG